MLIGSILIVPDVCRACLIGGSMSYYLDLSSDIYVTYLYSQNPDTYQSSWVILSAIFLSLPTCMSVFLRVCLRVSLCICLSVLFSCLFCLLVYLPQL